MNTYVLLGKYSAKALKSASPERTKDANKLVEKLGGKIRSIHSLLGDIDLLMLADFPGNEEAMKAAVGLAKLTGIGFSTYPALSVDRFDKIITD